MSRKEEGKNFSLFSRENDAPTKVQGRRAAEWKGGGRREDGTEWAEKWPRMTSRR